MATSVQRITFKTKPESTPWSALADMWREGERIEIFDGGWLFDHLYPIYGAKTDSCFEGWTALSYLAGRTQRVRLGLMVTAIPYRNPGLLAKMVTTFDHFSGGRLDFGVGAGWFEDEAAAYGMPLLPLGPRLTQFEEACEVLVKLLSQETTTFRGKHYQLTDARCDPKPLQKPHPPICMGGTGEKRMLRIVARFADDWNHPAGTPEDLTRKIEILHAHCSEIGRDPSEITISSHLFVTGDPAETAEQAARLAEVGAQHLCLYFQDNSKPAVMGPTAEAVAKAVGFSPA